MGRRNDHTRDEIKNMALDAGVCLLETDGATAVSARKIAKRINYTVGTLYLVFENLDDLILQINLRSLKLLQSTLLESTKLIELPIEQLKALALAYLSFAENNKNRWRLIYEHNSAIRSHVYDEYIQISKEMLLMIERSLSDLNHDKPQGEVTSVQEARALWGGVHGICILSLSDKLHHGAVPTKVMINLLIECFVLGYLHKGKGSHG